jgi:hypothetical protein
MINIHLTALKSFRRASHRFVVLINWPQKVAAETGSSTAVKKRRFCRLLIWFDWPQKVAAEPGS